MKNSRRKIFRIMTMCLMIVMMMSVTVFAEGEATEYVPKLYSTVWALVPPVVAITLALITKEVYSSLFVGIAVGGIFYGGGEYVPKLYSTVWALVPPVVAITLALITKEVYSSLFVGIAVGGIFYGGGNFERTITHVLYSTVWALVPPVVAITLALITKEVYSSLFVGIAVGGIFYGGGNFERTITHVLNDGLIGVLSDPYNVGILIFLVILGAMVSLMNRAGGSAAFGRWASQHIKTRVGAQITTIILGCLIFIDDYFNWITTIILGCLIFIDDYFNCLTVGSVMRPITDKHNVSRAKLAYLIDSTAAPICIIAPISSWAAAVTGFVPGEDGLSVFVQAIPFNFYALFTIIMMLGLVLLKVDYGPMKLHEDNAKKGDLFTTGARPYAYNEEVKENTKGHVLDLLIPIASLIVFCVIGMIYTGGFFSGESIVTAFSNADASVGLALGSFFALVVTIVLYVCRKALTFKECMDCIPEGFKSMVPAIMILTFAWSLKAMTDSLGAAPFVEGIMKGNAQALMNFLPAVIFLVGCFLAFATGTSWGTFGILIPIVVGVFANDHQMMIIAISACMAGAVCGDHCSAFATGTSWGTFGILIPIVVGVFANDHQMMIIAISACMAGAVCGDHCSPISDTTIMASAGSQSDHVNHVSTQIPYAATVAIISCITYIIAGFTKSAAISLGFGLISVLGTLAFIKSREKANGTYVE